MHCLPSGVSEKKKSPYCLHLIFLVGGPHHVPVNCCCDKAPKVDQIYTPGAAGPGIYTQHHRLERL